MDMLYLARKVTNVLHITEFMPLDPFDFFRHATTKLKGNENYSNSDIISTESCRVL